MRISDWSSDVCSSDLRNEENSEHSGSQHSADNTGPNRDSARRTGTGSNEERYHATDEGERRHDNGAQAQFHSFECRLKRGLALRFLLDRKLDDQDRVLGGQADDRDDANVEIDVGGQSPHHRKEDGAKYAERYNQKHGNRDGPALVESGQQQEYNKYRQA